MSDLASELDRIAVLAEILEWQRAGVSVGRYRSLGLHWRRNRERNEQTQRTEATHGNPPRRDQFKFSILTNIHDARYNYLCPRLPVVISFEILFFKRHPTPRQEASPGARNYSVVQKHRSERLIALVGSLTKRDFNKQRLSTGGA